MWHTGTRRTGKGGIPVIEKEAKNWMQAYDSGCHVVKTTQLKVVDKERKG